MSLALKTSILVLLISPYCFSQDPMPVLNSSWQRTIQKAQKTSIDATGPARAMTAADKYFPRKAREQRVDPPNDPSLMTEDDRRSAIEKAEQEFRIPKTEDVRGYSYVTNVRNDSGKTVKVIFWEYRFTEIKRPANVV